MLRGVLVAAVVAAVVASTAPVAAADNEPPLPAAGLDQEVQQGQVVYLDAGGSVDPDGDITRTEWTVTLPNGTTTTPACPTCVQTHFRANQSGTYTVTVAVTDDDGATREDTLYVTAEPSEPPTVTLTGPSTVSPGSQTTVEASVTAGGAPLQRVTWYRDGTRVGRESVGGQEATVTLSETFVDTGTAEVVAVATDEVGIESRDSHALGVAFEVESTDTGPSWTTWSSSNSQANLPSETLYRNREDGIYRIRISSDGTVRGGLRDRGTILTQEEVSRLEGYEGVKRTTSHDGWNHETEQIVITNEEIQSDIDKDSAQLGSGFKDDNLQYLNPDGFYDDGTDTTDESSLTDTSDTTAITDTTDTTGTTDTTDTTNTTSNEESSNQWGDLGSMYETDSTDTTESTDETTQSYDTESNDNLTEQTDLTHEGEDDCIGLACAGL